MLEKLVRKQIISSLRTFNPSSLVPLVHSEDSRVVVQHLNCVSSEQVRRSFVFGCFGEFSRGELSPRSQCHHITTSQSCCRIQLFDFAPSHSLCYNSSQCELHCTFVQLLVRREVKSLLCTFQSTCYRLINLFARLLPWIGRHINGIN